MLYYYNSYVGYEHNLVMRRHTSKGETPGPKTMGTIARHSLVERLFCHCCHPYHQVCGQCEHKPRARQTHRLKYKPLNHIIISGSPYLIIRAMILNAMLYYVTGNTHYGYHIDKYFNPYHHTYRVMFLCTCTQSLAWSQRK